MTLPEHGTVARYDRGCHCQQCRDAKAAYQRWRIRQNAYGRPRLVDATPVREHLLKLRTDGVGYRQLSTLTGFAEMTIVDICNGKTRQVKARTATTLLAFRPTLEQLSPNARVDSTGTRRRLQALVYKGWSQGQIAEQLGTDRRNTCSLFHGEAVLVRTALAVRDLYDRMWHLDPPTDTPRRKQVATRARNRARALGWAPALAWDDHDLDDPAATPNTGEGGLKFGHGRRIDLAEVEYLRTCGVAEGEIARRLNVDRDSIYRAEYRAAERQRAS